MRGRRLESVSEALLSFSGELAAHPLLADTVRVAVVSFADEPTLVLRLSDLTEIRSIPALRPGGSTAWQPLFNMLGKSISADRAQLRRQGVEVLRPVVFLLIDGPPQDIWDTAYDEFRSVSEANVIVIADEEVDSHTIARLKPLRAFRWNSWDGPGPRLLDAVMEIAETLTRSTLVRDEGGGSLHVSPMVPTDDRTIPTDDWL